VQAEHLNSMRDYLRMIFRRKAALFLPLVGGVLVVPLVWTLVPPKYRATALVRRKDLAVIASTPSSLVARGASNVSYKTLRVEIITPANLERVIRQLKMDVDLRTPADWMNKYDELRSAISIHPVAQTRGVDLIEISAISTSPLQAQRIANAIADNYVEQSKRIGRMDTYSAMDFHKEQAEEYLKKLRETEDELDRYRQEHFADLPDIKNAILERLLALRTEETSRSLQLADAEQRLAEIDKQLSEVPPTIHTDVVTEPNPEYTALKEQLDRYRKALDAALLRYTEEHPQVKRMREEISLLEKRLQETPPTVSRGEREVPNPIYQRLAGDRLSLQQEIRGHRAALKEIQARIKANEDEIRGMVNDEKRYTDLMRDYREYSQIYEQYRRSLVASRTRLEAEAGRYGTQVELVQRALLPASPYQMDRLKLSMMCLVGGLACGVALMLILEFCDHSFRTAEEASAFLGLPVLATIPTIVTPEAMARRRRRIALALSTGAALLLAAAVGLFMWERERPGTLLEILEKIHTLVRAYI